MQRKSQNKRYLENRVIQPIFFFFAFANFSFTGDKLRLKEVRD